MMGPQTDQLDSWPCTAVAQPSPQETIMTARTMLGRESAPGWRNPGLSEALVMIRRSICAAVIASCSEHAERARVRCRAACRPNAVETLSARSGERQRRFAAMRDSRGGRRATCSLGMAEAGMVCCVPGAASCGKGVRVPGYEMIGRLAVNHLHIKVAGDLARAGS